MALEVGEGDEVWTSPNSFVASANCALYCGAKIKDTDSRTGNMCPNDLAQRLECADKKGSLPKLIIPVHLSGAPCDMEAISKLAKQFGCLVLEDASHAVGVYNCGSFVGSGKYADITVFSFHPVKIITTSEGGMALSNNAIYAERMRDLRTHGITKDASRLSWSDSGEVPAWYYEQQSLGFNYRMSDIHAALGCSQLVRLESFIQARVDQARIYDAALSNIDIDRPVLNENSSWHLYRVGVQASIRDVVFQKMRDAGIGVQVHYYPIHLQPYYKILGFAKGDFPIFELFSNRSISIPIFPTF